MLCQRCKKNIATVNHVEIINGNKFEGHFCAMCYAELAGDLNSKASNFLWTDPFGEQEAYAEMVCPECGARYSDYEKTGLVGCANCYTAFRDRLLPAIERIQGKSVHVGQSSGNKDEMGLHRLLKDLQEQLETALKERRYNDASILNRRIDDIKKVIYGGDGDE